MYLDNYEKRTLKRLLEDWDRNHEKDIAVVLRDETVVTVENQGEAVKNIINQYCSSDVQKKHDSLTYYQQNYLYLYIEAKTDLQEVTIDEFEEFVKDFDVSDADAIANLEYEIQNADYPDDVDVDYWIR